MGNRFLGNIITAADTYGAYIPPPPPALYTFTTFTFTTGGATGSTGPSLATLLNSYNTTAYPWLTNTSYFNMTSQGIQLWTVPQTGSYTINAKGARGGISQYGAGGYGASITGTFDLTKSDIIRILVGQSGIDNNIIGGGGGGTFVVKNSGNTTSDILVIAGGGGGGYYSSYDSTYKYSSATTTANPGWSGGYSRTAGVAGTGGGGGGIDQTGTGGGPGGGFLTNGTLNGMYSATSEGSGGYAFVNGGNAYANETYWGGFGGGGSGDWYSWTGGGGGGGYNGGGGGHYYGPGGGGSSYNNGTSQTNTANANNGHGQVIITKV